MSKSKVSLFLGMALVLVLAVTMQMLGPASQRKNMIAPNIGDLIPREIPGWTVEDRPIAESPDLQKTVDAVLNYDSAIFRVYKRNNLEIAVYLAYWLPGKIDPELIDEHTPDICWVANGWKMEKLPGIPTEKNNGLPMPNHRQFTAGTQKLTVLYWQISGHQIRQSNSVLEAGLSFTETVERRMSRVWSAITNPPGQQVFIRISSNGAIDTQLGYTPISSCIALMDRIIKGDDLYRMEQ